MEQRTIPAELFEDVRSVFEADASGHDYYHTLRVYRMAVRLAKLENADPYITGLAALLHDVDDYKLNGGIMNSFDRASLIMDKYAIDDSVRTAVREIIYTISFKGDDSEIPEAIEGKCVQDADRLDAIGAIGIARAFAYGGSRSRIIHDPEIKPREHMNEKDYREHASTTINHFYEKLLRLKDMMTTQAGRQIATRRNLFMQTYLDEFFEEWNGIA